MPSPRRVIISAVILSLVLVVGSFWLRAGSLDAVRFDRDDLPPSAWHGISIEQASLWAAVNEGGTGDRPLSGTEHASDLDVISAAPGAYVGQVEDMRVVNPGIELLAYMNGALAQADETGEYPDSWYARDKSGNLIRSTSYGNVLMKVWDPRWRQERALRCDSVVRASKYAGCMVDVMGLAPLAPGYLTGTPVRPESDLPWSARDWLREASGLIRVMKAKVGDETPVVVNGLGSGELFFDAVAPTSVLLQEADGAVAEGWLKWPGAPASRCPTPERLDADLRMLDTANQIDKNILVMTKLWGEATAEERARWEEFAFATYLLGMNHNTRFAFSAAEDADPASPSPLLRTEIGVPIGERYRVEGLLVRKYSHVTVVANPGARSVTIVVPGGSETVQGEAVDRLELGPCEARIFVAS